MNEARTDFSELTNQVLRWSDLGIVEYLPEFAQPLFKDTIALTEKLREAQLKEKVCRVCGQSQREHGGEKTYV